MSTLVQILKLKAATCERQVQRLSWWFADFEESEARKEGDHCRHLVKLAVDAGLLTKGEALAFYQRAKACHS